MLRKRPCEGRNPSPFSILFVTILSVVSCMGLVPIKSEKQIESLAGIQKVYVIVNIGLSREGPTRRGLQAKVESSLEEGGLSILRDIEEEKMASVPILNIDISIWKNAVDPYIYFAHANFYQPVHLARDSKFQTQAATWRARLIGAGNIDGITRDVEKIAKIFVKDHKKAKKITKK